jgi:hypothetical protein
VLARAGLHLRAIDRQRPEPDDPRFAGDSHRLHEQRLKRRQVLLPKLGDRPVRREIAGRQHAIRHVLFQLPGDPTRRERPGRIRVQQHRHQHLRIEGLIAPPIPRVGRVARLEIQRVLNRMERRVNGGKHTGTPWTTGGAGRRRVQAREAPGPRRVE